MKDNCNGPVGFHWFLNKGACRGSLVKILSKSWVDDIPTRVAKMFNNMNEQVWQFHLEDGSQFKDNGRAYFETRASELASTIGCNLAASKNVYLEFAAGRWKVTGTAILDIAKAMA
jgi:hypothetical protein